eukprot:TRINITY_DN769_c4_g1_i1.p1 TRINITY_DN769_c4_g1~~TRINITY_DN769_c4_g1_i1.p1  ORF type:complete len:159 (+),score=36.27 TRINITY_DN769_c4_g1_i1:45-479(+)
MDPMSETRLPWLLEHNEQRAVESGLDDEGEDDGGKWMLFYPNDEINAAWHRSVDLYRAGHLPGVHSMKVSTAMPNPRASTSASKVIIFYCGPSKDEAKMRSIGTSLASAMQVTGTTITYKPDYMTATGTAATGQKVNHLYKLRV